MLNQAISKTEYKGILEVLAQEIPHGLLFSGVQRRITEYQIRYGYTKKKITPYDSPDWSDFCDDRWS